MDKTAILSPLACLLAGAISLPLNASAADVATDDTLAIFASTQGSVRLKDGRTIHLTCTGEGSPAVILTAGAGDWGISWHTVLPELGRRYLTCTWDRAGFGLSDPSPHPQVVTNTTDDLEGALQTAGIEGPYILAGHSFGAFESILFAVRHREKVRGIVLVDPAVPDAWARRERVAPAVGADARQYTERLLEFLAACESVLADRSSRSPQEVAACLPRLQPQWPEEVGAAIRHAVSASTMRTMASFFAMADRSGQLMAGHALGDIPLITLGATLVDPPAGAPAAVVEQWPRYVEDWKLAQRELAQASSRGEYRAIPRTTHYVHVDRPDAVIDAIDELAGAPAR
jgi:pimeloyl-ACP methyl ester carboxylesterase|nr:MAG: hypothetical protein DIU62_11110 [Pseudomonadota bacterium]